MTYWKHNLNHEIMSMCEKETNKFSEIQNSFTVSWVEKQEKIFSLKKKMKEMQKMTSNIIELCLCVLTVWVCVMCGAMIT